MNDRPESWRADLLRLIAGHVCLHGAMSGMRMAAPLFVLSQGYDKTAAGVLVALFAATQIFLSLPAGRYADRRGLRRPLAWCVVASTGGIASAAALPSYPVLCITALLCGGAIGTAVIALQRHLGRSAQTHVQRMQAFSWLSIAPAIGNFGGPLAMGLAVDHFGFRAAFAAFALLPLPVWFLARASRESHIDANASAGPQGSALELLSDRATRRVLLVNIVMTSSWDLHSFMVPVLGYERGLDASQIGLILGVFALCAAFIRLVMPAIAVRVQEWRLLVFAIAIAGVLLIAYPFTNSLSTMLLCSSLMGMALGSVQPNVLSLLHVLAPSHRHGEALALRMIAVNVSALLMPLLLGVTAGAIGSSGVFWVMGGVVTVGSRLGASLRRRTGTETTRD